MNHPAPPSTPHADRSTRVLVLAPRGRDGPVLAASLRAAGIEPVECVGIEPLCALIHGGAGALLVTQEGLTPEAQRVLLGCLAGQPPWSSLPVIILTMARAGVDTLASFLGELGPVGTAITVERPIKPETLQSVLRMALLARERQYQLRGHLAEIDNQRWEIARHRDNLQALVDERTAELRESLRKTQDAQRLAALGNMAAGVGHDIANMTLPIRTRLEPLAASASAAVREDVEAIGKSLEHLTNLSAGLRLMAMDPTRDGASAPAHDLRAWSEQADGVLRNAVPRGVAFECDIPEGVDLPGVNMPSHRLTQAVFNLVQNAGEAIAGGAAGTAAGTTARGVVRLSVRVVEAGTTERPGLVEIAVSDNGPGIAPEHLDRIFEPYFTTKGRAIATGMGLGMVRGLIESSGGSVRVESAPGKGATFRLTLPAVAATRGPAGDAQRHTAAVTLSDARQQALAEAILSGLRVNVLKRSEYAHAGTGGAGAAGGAGVPDVDVWIAAAPAAEAMESFLRSTPGGRLVIVGGDGGPKAGTNGHASGHVSGRVIHLPRQAGPAMLRDALVSVVRATGAPAGAGSGAAPGGVES